MSGLIEKFLASPIFRSQMEAIERADATTRAATHAETCTEFDARHAHREAEIRRLERALVAAGEKREKQRVAFEAANQAYIAGAAELQRLRHEGQSDRTRVEQTLRALADPRIDEAKVRNEQAIEALRREGHRSDVHIDYSRIPAVHQARSNHRGLEACLRARVQVRQALEQLKVTHVEDVAVAIAEIEGIVPHAQLAVLE